MKYITEEKARILADIFGIMTQDSKSCGYWQKGAKPKFSTKHSLWLIDLWEDFVFTELPIRIKTKRDIDYQIWYPKKNKSK